MPAAFPGQRVIACAAVVLGELPLGSNQALPLETVERRIERALPELQNALGPLLDPLGDAPSVHRLELQGLQHEHVEGALEEVSAISHASPFDRRKKSTRGSLRLSKGVTDAS